MREALYEFEHFLRQHDLNPSIIEADSKKRRCPTADKPKKKNAEYCLHPERDGWFNGWFRDYSKDVFEKFAYNTKTEKATRSKVNKEAIKKLREKAQRRKEAHERDTHAKREKTSKRATRIWNQAKPVESHPYLEKKGISAYGVKQLSGQELRHLGCYEIKSFPGFEAMSFLILPIWNIHNKLVSLQLIAPCKNKDGRDKTFLKNGMKRGGFCVLCPKDSTLQDSENVYMCEGYATGASILEAANAPVVVTFDAGNLHPVMDAFRADTAFAGKHYILCADNDEAKHQSNGKPINPGIKAALEVCTKHPDTWLTFPTFKDVSALPSDFNDLHQQEGVERVKQYLSAATQTTYLLEEYLNSTTPKTLCFLHPQKHLSDLSELKHVPHFSDAAIYAGPGVGKSHYTLNGLPSQLPKEDKLVAFSPKRVLASQKAKDTTTGVELHVIKGGSQYNQRARIQTSTYNGSEKIWPQDLKRITAVIDECHDTTTSQGYRPEVIEAMQDILQGCKRRIWITATPAPAGKVYNVEHEFFVFSHLQRREIETVKTNGKNKTLFNVYGQQAGTKLVYCYKTTTAEELTEKAREMGFRADYIISRTEQDGIYKTAAHRELVEEQKVNKDLDFLFVSSYPAEGVDILQHNISCIICYDWIAPWLLFQLVNRTRKADSIPIKRFRSYEAAKKPVVNRSWDTKTEKEHFDEIFSIAEGFTKPLNALVKKDKPEALRVCQTLAKSWTACLEENAGAYTVKENSIRFKTYQEWERYCRISESMFLRELAKYNIFEKKATEAAEQPQEQTTGNRAFLTDEKEKAIEKRLKNEREQRFQNELVCAAGLSDAELTKETPRDTEAKRRLAALYNECGDFEFSVKILKKIGSSKRKYRKVLDQFTVQHYYNSQDKDAMLESVRDISKTPKITHIEAERILTGIYKEHDFLAQALERPDLTPVQAIQDLGKFFELKRHTSRNGAYYEILSENPLRKYEKTRISGELKERVESRKRLENQSNHVDTFLFSGPKEPECKSVYMVPALSNETQVLPPNFEKELSILFTQTVERIRTDLASEYATEQERIFGKVF